MVFSEKCIKDRVQVSFYLLLVWDLYNGVEKALQHFLKDDLLGEFLLGVELNETLGDDWFV